MINRLAVPSTTLVVGAGPLDAPVKRKRARLALPPSSSNNNNNYDGTELPETLSQAEITRRRNALYSRRSNKRRDLALISLQDQKRILTARNQALQADNARLEALLVWAQGFIPANNNQNNNFNHGYGFVASL